MIRAEMKKDRAKYYGGMILCDSREAVSSHNDGEEDIGQRWTFASTLRIEAFVLYGYSELVNPLPDASESDGGAE